MKEEISISIETSGKTGSVCLAKGEEIVQEIVFSDILRHGAETLPSIETLFSSNNLSPEKLDYIYVSAGPGSFTGIRLAVTMAKTLAYALGAKIISVPSLEATALNADTAMDNGIKIENIAVVLEAGRGNVFAAAYQYHENYHIKESDKSFLPNYKTLIEATMTKPELFLQECPKPLKVIGEGIDYHKKDFMVDGVEILDSQYHNSRSANVFKCGLLRRKQNVVTDFNTFTPIYMRKPEAELNLLKQI